jgi:hypothetical protein
MNWYEQKYIVTCGCPEQWETAETIEEARRIAKEQSHLNDEDDPVGIRKFDLVELIQVTKGA